MMRLPAAPNDGLARLFYTLDWRAGPGAAPIRLLGSGGVQELEWLEPNIHWGSQIDNTALFIFPFN